MKGVTYVRLVDKLASIGINEKQANVANKLPASFLLQCLEAIGALELRLG